MCTNHGVLKNPNTQQQCLCRNHDLVPQKHLESLLWVVSRRNNFLSIDLHLLLCTRQSASTRHKLMKLYTCTWRERSSWDQMFVFLLPVVAFGVSCSVLEKAAVEMSHLNIMLNITLCSKYHRTHQQGLKIIANSHNFLWAVSYQIVTDCWLL